MPEAKQEQLKFDLFAKKIIFSVIIVAVVIIVIGFVGAYQIGRITQVEGPPSTYCGDGKCQEAESCSTCPADCGQCSLQKPYCGDGVCQSTESCSSCQIDCGQCPPPEENKIDITIKVIDESTGKTISGADIYFDGESIGMTAYDGTKKVSNTLEGSHVVRVVYKDSEVTRYIDVYPEKIFEIRIQLPIDATLTIIDEETKKPVINENVYLDDILKGSTLQTGEVLIKDVIPGDYTLSLNEVIGKPSRRITIQRTTLTIEVDMPNPEFSASALECWDWWGVFDEIGKCAVELKNMGEVDSDSTAVLLLIYTVDTKTNEISEKPITEKLLDFGNIAPGAYKVRRETDEMSEFIWGPKEDVVAIVFDRQRYMPQNENVISEVSIPSNLITEWVLEAKDYCSANPERCAKIAGIFVGNVIKTAAA